MCHFHRFEIAESLSQLVEDVLDNIPHLPGSEILFDVAETPLLAGIEDHIDSSVLLRRDDVVDAADDVRVTQTMQDVDGAH